jgi:glycosyltransferase involved in cell wall biosynthesis
MAAHVKSLVTDVGDIAITPFGVDIERFGREEPSPSDRAVDSIVIGTVKRLAPKYGIDTFLLAAKLLQRRLQETDPTLAEKLRLRIVGDGPQEQNLRQLAAELDIARITEFVGRVPHSRVPSELNKLDIYAALSRFDSESFGVAVIEAGAARKPVVVSDAGGLPEVVVPGVTGLVVPRNSPQSAALAMEVLFRDPGLRLSMGMKGSEHVRRKYDWQACVREMLEALENTRRRAGLASAPGVSATSKRTEKKARAHENREHKRNHKRPGLSE